MPANQTAIRDDVTARIIQALESNLLPWRRPWRTTAGGLQPARHSNITSRKPYSGVNPLLLELHAMRHGFQSRWWATWAAWKSLGCNIRKRPPEVEEGGWGAKVVFWKPITRKTVTDDQTGDEEDERFFVLKTYCLFNAEQVGGEAAEQYQVDEEPSQPQAEPDFAPAEELIAATGADIRHGGERAFYDLAGDYVRLPSRDRFATLGAYYETALHELAHWSEPRQQFDRPKLGYAMCELVAEMAACFVASEIGVPQGEGLENHAAYVKSWLERMKGDRTFIFRAAKLADRTCDYLLSFVPKPEPEAVGVAQ